MTSSAASARELSPLELFHPDGIAEAVVVAGTAIPPFRSGAVASDGPLDLLVLGTSKELEAEEWLDAYLPRLSPDGLLYVFLPPGRRRSRVVRELRRRGLDVQLRVAHVPSAETSRYLVPLGLSVAGTAFSRVVAVWPRRRRVLGVLLRLPGASRVAARLLPALALVARKPGARPLFEWISSLPGAEGPPEVEALVTTGRAATDRVVVVLADGDRVPSLVVKVGDRSSARLEREAQALAALGASVKTAGAAVPEVRSVRSLGMRSVLVETRLAGEPAAALLASQPRRLHQVLDLLAEWIDSWHRATLIERAMALEELEQHAFAAAQRLSPLLDGNEPYLSWLRSRCEEAAGEGVSVVATHNDLTMFNVLVSGETIGILDWEEASERGLPLTDFFYAAVDATAAAARYASLADAFDSCFARDGRQAAAVARIRRRLMAATGTSPALADVAFHTCWLGHAVNEHEREGARADLPFLGILQRVAASPEAWSFLGRA